MPSTDALHERARCANLVRAYKDRIDAWVAKHPFAARASLDHAKKVSVSLSAVIREIEAGGSAKGAFALPKDRLLAKRIRQERATTQAAFTQTEMEEAMALLSAVTDDIEAAHNPFELEPNNDR